MIQEIPIVENMFPDSQENIEIIKRYNFSCKKKEIIDI